MTSFVSLVVALTVFASIWFLRNVFTSSHDLKEPPVTPSTIPWIGHALGVLKHGTAYYSRMAKKCKQPIFTLSLPRAKMYIVTSPGLATACDKRAKTISFAPYVVEFGKRILLSSQHGIDLLSEDLLEENGPVSLRPETMQTMHRSLQGRHLEETTQTVLKNLTEYFDSEPYIGDEKGILLFGWIRQFTTMISTNAIWGPAMNPMLDSEVSKGFWAVDRSFALLGLMVYPDLIAREANRGRQRFFDAFRAYYARDWPKTASYLTKARYEVNKNHGVSDNDIAQYDLGVCTALLVNTVPAVFWTVCYVFSDQALLRELRHGIENACSIPQFGKITQDSTLSTVTVTVTVNLEHVIRAFPLLEALVKEVLRVQSTTASARYLLQDTLVDDGKGHTYLLKKDSMLAMPSVPLHESEEVWGENAQSFDPTRFLKQQGRKVPASANRTFGGGNALCPGRHLAVREIVSILAILVMKYDIKPQEGIWKMPQAKNHIATSIRTPLKDLSVVIQPRKEAKYVRWNFVWEPKDKVES